MIRFFVEHWELKVVALVIAIALWIYTNGQVRIERTLIVHLPDSAVQSLPETHRVTEIQPQAREFTIKISIPESLLHSLKSEAVVPKLVIGADALQTGAQSFPITNRILGLDDDIRIERVEPASVKEIRVLFAAVVEDYLPIEIPRLIGVPEGLESTVALEHTRVRVRGTREQIDRFRQANLKLIPEPIALDDIDPLLQQPRQEQVKLAVRNARLEVLDPVTATIVLKPVSGSRQVVSLPVQVLASRDFCTRFQVELSQPQVAITVHGPENLLRALRPETDLTAYVNLRRGLEPNVAQEVPVGLLAPSWLSWDPATVRVTATLLQAKAPQDVNPATPASVEPVPGK